MKTYAVQLRVYYGYKYNTIPSTMIASAIIQQAKDTNTSLQRYVGKLYITDFKADSQTRTHPWHKNTINRLTKASTPHLETTLLNEDTFYATYTGYITLTQEVEDEAKQLIKQSAPYIGGKYMLAEYTYYTQVTPQNTKTYINIPILPQKLEKLRNLNLKPKRIIITRQPGKNYPNQYEPITLEPTGDHLEIKRAETPLITLVTAEHTTYVGDTLYKYIQLVDQTQDEYAGFYIHAATATNSLNNTTH
ncbi:hypothetical protein B9Q04_04690 [Candidatus Marsarchaeota G2 archaeon BE_D]|jgi:hypothetical protein|uniref:Uncharacterized protein n=4 Tax=Candidatus Marsarchaeota group 2 TaxID=2203771 RepID=A0A2R6CCH5_9ARCH|nr:MAG: hypothetical protein B9Q06_05845 [Candidatus Marsarchaeota G2 archaeon ECH_B_2]PSN98291.1 MAG: hypothetical protein B9Q07_10115 [Candidatus Marsarchaeota G2 archaeon ECH_B_3]PSO00013.1 MAG: hypothetical protein B9Q05_11055 [Candidatus Marsarchaeota G2 archaeon ECH_B_1]PSO08602.1 MAG: hypothetical protein B9Q04_04690 [Candidatus Marsarchaeota G2 archaeon BE_D]